MFDERFGVTRLLRPCDQAMGIACVRLPRDALEIERDADAVPHGLHPRIDLRSTLSAAELGFEVVGAGNSLRRQVGIELERMPAHRDFETRLASAKLGKGLRELALADVAPGTDDVGDDIDGEMGSAGGRMHNAVYGKMRARRSPRFLDADPPPTLGYLLRRCR